MHRPTKVISGGQSGADLVALEVAKANKIPTGGWAPHGMITPAMVAFGMEEHAPPKGKWSMAQAYMFRSMANVDAADATLAFRTKPSPGTDKTVYYCATGRWPKQVLLPAIDTPRIPYLVVNPLMLTAASEVRAWLDKVRPPVLNIAGHRDDGTAETAAYMAAVHAVLTKVLKNH